MKNLVMATAFAMAFGVAAFGQTTPGSTQPSNTNPMPASPGLPSHSNDSNGADNNSGATNQTANNNNADNQASGSMAGARKLKGCIRSEGGRYMLVEKHGKKEWALGGSQDFASYVGHTVTVHGSFANRDASNSAGSGNSSNSMSGGNMSSGGMSNSGTSADSMNSGNRRQVDNRRLDNSWCRKSTPTRTPARPKRGIWVRRPRTQMTPANQVQITYRFGKMVTQYGHPAKRGISALQISSLRLFRCVNLLETPDVFSLPPGII